MIEIAVKFRVDSVDEMRGEVKAFLDALREYCGADVVVTTADEGEATEEIGIGYRYDNGEPINDELRKLCKKAGVDDWRKISLWDYLFATTIPNPAGEKYPPCERDDISSKLIHAGIESLGDLTQCSKKALSIVRHIGSGRIKVIQEKLNKLGLSLVEY